MSARKRGRPTSVPDAEARRRIAEWKNLTELCKELGVSLHAARWIRMKCRQVSK